MLTTYNPGLIFKTFCRDCIYPVNEKETRIRVCIQAATEWLSSDAYNKIKNKFPLDPDTGIPIPNELPFLIFYECMIALNVETIDDEFEEKQIRRSGKSFSRDYEMLTIEICFLGNINVF